MKLTICPPLLTKGVNGAFALMIWTLTVAAKPAPQTSDDDWTVPAMIVGIMVFMVLFNSGSGKGGGGIGAEGGDGCGGGCGGGD